MSDEIVRVLRSYLPHNSMTFGKGWFDGKGRVVVRVDPETGLYKDPESGELLQARELPGVTIPAGFVKRSLQIMIGPDGRVDRDVFAASARQKIDMSKMYLRCTQEIVDRLELDEIFRELLRTGTVRWLRGPKHSYLTEIPQKDLDPAGKLTLSEQENARLRARVAELEGQQEKVDTKALSGETSGAA